MDLVRNCVPPPHVFEHGVNIPNALITQSTGAGGVGDGVGDGVGACVGADVGLDVGDALGALVGLNVGAKVGASVGVAVGERVGASVGLGVGDGVGHSVNGQRSTRFRSVHKGSLDVRVRNLMPRLPHEAVHALNSPKLEYVAGLHVHTKLLHGRTKINAPQPLPPCAGAVTMDLVRDCTPPPHVFEHVAHLPNGLSTQ